MAALTTLIVNQDISSDGYIIYREKSSSQIVLFYNIVGPITGTGPSISFSLQEVDPSDEITPNGEYISTDPITTSGAGQLVLNFSFSPSILLSWTVSGTNPVFQKVNAAAISKEFTNNVNPTSTLVSDVLASTTSNMMLSSNNNRLGASIWNESDSSILYLKLGTTAAINDYTVQVYPSGYYEVPYGYTGRIDAIWSSNSGSARITEFLL